MRMTVSVASLKLTFISKSKAISLKLTLFVLADSGKGLYDSGQLD